MADFVQLIKKAAYEAIEASKPCRIVYGEVTAISPIKVRIEQKITLTEDFLIIPEHLTDHNVTLSRDGSDIVYTYKNALVTGEKVALLQQKGGQKFLVLDRVM